jgi:hypothetical protein
MMTKETIKEVLKKMAIILVVVVVLDVAYTAIQMIFESEPEAIVTDNTNQQEAERIMDAIKKTEAEQPPRIGNTPTAEEIYNSPYIKHIRGALNGYLDGTNIGVEGGALDPESNDGLECGLDKFSKTYYQSEFAILDAYDNDYGGVQAYIVFIDKPDTVFWVWVYRLGSWDSEDGEYVLRALCEKPPLEEDRDIFKAYIEDEIKTAEYLF